MEHQHCRRRMEIMHGNGNTTSTGGDHDDCVIGYSSEEEVAAYKTSGSATSAESELINEQQQQEGQENALISAISLFLVKTWSWLYHYFFVLVTIIFLNFEEMQPTRRDSVDSFDSYTSSEGSGNLGDTEDVACDKSSEVSVIIGSCDKSDEGVVLGDTEDGFCDKSDEDSGNGDMEDVSCDKSEVSVILGEDAEDGSCDKSDEGVNLGDTEDGFCDKASEDSGNGDTEDACDKSSEENDIVIGNEKGDENNAKQVALKIVSQVESMFSDEHLAKDGFLLKHVRRRSDGFVSLKLVAGLRKVRQISREFPVVLDALKDSTKLEVNPDGTKVRRVEPLTPFLKSIAIKSKEKDAKGKDKENHGSSTDEIQQPAAAVIQQNNKFASKSGNSNKENHGQTRRHSNAPHPTNNNNSNNGQPRRHSHAQNHNRKSSNTSTASSNSSRNNSFSKAPGVSHQHPADLFRNVCAGTMAAFSSEDCQNSTQVGRKRGGSLPIAALNNRASAAAGGVYLSPNSSPPNNGTFVIGPNGLRPKSNSYCEGASPTTMSPWLQRRKASASSRLSNGDLVFTGVLRQPRGPDGTKGFPDGYRAMILQERLQQQNSAVSA